ncbi:MAG: hypothetical protein AAFY37_08240 [Pseudomonadota bacterium]
MRTATSIIDDDTLLTKDVFDARLADQGVELDAHTIRTWRTRGLLPHSVRGGLARYDESSVAQAVEAARLFAGKDNEAHVGWELWWRGFDVAEPWWRPTIEVHRGKRTSAMRRIAKYVAPPQIDAPTSAEIVWTLHEAIESGRTPEAGDLPDAVKKLAALRQSEGERILSAPLKVEAAVRTLLDTCASAPNPKISSLHFKPVRVERLYAARDTVRCVLEAGAALHDAMATLAPRRALRLKPLKWLSEESPKTIRADLAVRWMAAGDLDRPEILPDAAASLRADAFATRSAAEDVARSIKARPDVRSACTPQRLRNASRRQDALAALAGRVRRQKDA